MSGFALALCACLLERLLGYPKSVQKQFGHPVQWIGGVITFLETRLNAAPGEVWEARLRGGAALVLLLLATAFPAYVLERALDSAPGGTVLNILLATTLIAQKSLHDHVKDVELALLDSLAAARGAVAKIVGRDTSQLDESGVAKAALESLAENTSDGIVAPVLWYALLGLPGLVAYKAINTADSMIGHRDARYQHFGSCAAIVDDVVNLPASRLTALLFAGAAGLTSWARGKAALAMAWRDAGKHRSPNAGWPEAAMAGALALRFGGPRSYADGPVDLPWMGDGRETMKRLDIAEGLKLYGGSLKLMWVLLLLAWLV
jgi:adenosylcobinamide-phosphate synthase